VYVIDARRRLQSIGDLLLCREAISPIPIAIIDSILHIDCLSLHKMSAEKPATSNNKPTTGGNLLLTNLRQIVQITDEDRCTLLGDQMAKIKVGK
jgi:hypothetical protein